MAEILNKEMSDSLCKCFTGRMSRLINTLNGFDENIKINISDAEQIGNIFIIVRQKLEEENKYTDELFKEIVKRELQERNYSENFQFNNPINYSINDFEYEDEDQDFFIYYKKSN